MEWDKFALYLEEWSVFGIIIILMITVGWKTEWSFDLREIPPLDGFSFQFIVIILLFAGLGRLASIQREIKTKLRT